MGTIYEIICWTTGLRYIGQTKLTLKLRLKCHESDFRKNVNECSSRFVLQHGNYEIYELKKIKNKKKLIEKEKYYIQHTDCVNIMTYDHSKKEYGKKYRKTNIDNIREKRKENYTCECGKNLRKDSKYRHEFTQKHIDFMLKKKDNFTA